MMFDTEIDKTAYLGFPPYEQEDAEAPYVVDICLPEKKDLEKFVELIDGMDSLLEPGKRSIKSYWYPKLEFGARAGGGYYIWVEDES